MASAKTLKELREEWKSPRMLHGTLRDNVVSIKKHGLTPSVGRNTEDAYGDEPLEDAIFLAHEKENPHKAFSAIRNHIGIKLKKHPKDVSDTDIEKHGALFTVRPDKHNVYKNTEAGYQKNFAGGYRDDRPYQAEPNDYYSTDDVPVSGVLTGKRLVHYIKKKNRDGKR